MTSRIRAGSAFAVPRKGETFELRSGLVSQYASERKDAIQRVIAAMTLGKDVSALFPDVLKNIATHDLAQKKLVYLYLINYAKSHPDLCILAVNTFVQDSEDPNPLVRALSIRTMGCIRVEKILDYLTEPLRKTMRDSSPYVRKTAAICVAKLFDLDAERCIENGFLDDLHELIADSNPMVVANAVTGLMEMQETNPDTNAFVVDEKTLSKLLVALNECTEWGRVAVLNAISSYVTRDTEEAEHICERVTPQFQHANSSVVMAALKVIMRYIDFVSPSSQESLLKKMSPPLVTLVSAQPEVQYVALRNINLILQKRPSILSKEIRVFFCKFNDPEYVKLEKLDIMIKLANTSNMDQLLAELKEYASEVDVDFVRRSVRAIGECALKVEETAQKCVNVLLELIQTKVNYVVQESIVVIKDIFRKYPGQYEAVIPELCKSLDDLDEPNARSSMIWIIGENAEKINNADELLEAFMENFNDEYTQVQLQLLTAVVKLFLKKPKSAQGIVQRMLQKATAECDNADIRDRAYVYWRLLSADPAKAKEIVLGHKPQITFRSRALPAKVLDELLLELASLASVFHKPAANFIVHTTVGLSSLQRRAIEEQKQLANEDPIQATTKGNIENLLELDFSSADAQESTAETGRTNANDLMGLFDSDAAPGPSNQNDMVSMFSGLDMNTFQVDHNIQKEKQDEDILGLF